MADKDNLEFEWDIRSHDGKITEGNEWAKDLAEQIASVCHEHGKGFIFAPWGGSNTNCRSFFATSHTDPAYFGAGISMMVSNYLKNNPAFKSEKEIVKWVGTIMYTALKAYKGELDDGKTD